ncbi:MAG: family 43 glycosylhydrolase [Clostridiales bacterium]|nr:family 43 glycosylhydrolase [Clostridiales bacterium]
MKKQVYNPYLPSWEYVPDGEPHVFGDRVYVYGSHDMYNGHVFCLGDYVCWSAPVSDLTDWRYEGVIYEKTQDPENPLGKMCLYAPDVTVGSDGKYYLYYALDKLPIISVAVCDTPAGKYQFYGYVHDSKGNRLGEREGDEPQFDPAVITEGDKTYLYTGFSFATDASRHGAMATVLASDMLTIVEEPEFVVPSGSYSKGSGFEGHEFFEASSIRKKGDTYYFIYSSVVMHELCYATSKHPRKDFKYGGVIVSNSDLGIDTYKAADKPTYYGANNHGGIVLVEDQWYIFYHRHTNGTWYSRQGCAEKIEILEDGSIPQVEITSCGLNKGPLEGKGEYPTYIACNLFTAKDNVYVGAENCPKIMQDGRDGDHDPGYVSNIQDTTTIGFKYFKFDGVKKVSIKARGYASGNFEVRTTWNGPLIGKIPVQYTNIWEEYTENIEIPSGVHAIYLTYRGEGTADLLSMKFE